MTTINADKMHAFVEKMLVELGACTSLPLVLVGDKLGLYRTLHEGGPCTSQQLAERSGISERYAREWLRAQAAAGYLAYDAATDRFELPPEHAMVFAIEDSPFNMLGGFELAATGIETIDRVAEAFTTGAGIAWGDLGGCLFCAVGRFFRPGYVNSLVQEWIPALDGVKEKLERGAKVADIGCGVGFSTILMAEAFPNSEFVGFDFHARSIQEARRHAASHGGNGRLRFEQAAVKEIHEDGFDLATCFDCLHDMGDPRGNAERIRQILEPGGTWMVVEPLAGDQVPDNLNPVGRLYYNASTMICVPTSLAQEVGTALGAQAGERQLAEVIRDGGFRFVRRAAEGPFNMVLEAKP